MDCEDFVKDSTTILASAAAPSKLGKIAYSIPHQPGTVHDLLLQKRDGTFDLVVWDERVKGVNEVTVDLGQVYPSVNIYDPTRGTSAVYTSRRVSSVALTLSNHPEIITPRSLTLGVLMFQWPVRKKGCRIMFENYLWKPCDAAVSEFIGIVMAGLVLITAPTVVAEATATTAVSAARFLSSIGVNTHVQHGENASKMIGMLKYLGVRNIRDAADNNYNVSGLILLHRKAGVHVVFGPGSGAKTASLHKTIIACRKLALAGALLAVEGPNEPNNFGGVSYHRINSTKTKNWMPVAEYQRALYRAVKRDPILKRYPVFNISEAGAEDNNVGLQYLKIPAGAGTLMPTGTVFADFANVHNYVCGLIKGPVDNQAYKAASNIGVPGFDGIFGNQGITWREHFTGYSAGALATLPKVTTETGWKTDGTPSGDVIQGDMILDVFLDQYTAGWRYTFIYELMDDSRNKWGFYKANYVTARKSADYLHNLTTILASAAAPSKLGKIAYSIPHQPGTVHDLLLQKRDGTFDLVVWDERVKGVNEVTVDLGQVYPSVNIYDPTRGTSAVYTPRRVSSVALTLSNHPEIIEISRRAR